MKLNIAVYSTEKIFNKLNKHNNQYNNQNHKKNIIKHTSEYKEICDDLNAGNNYDMIFIDLALSNAELLMGHIRKDLSDHSTKIILIAHRKTIPASVIKYKPTDCFVKSISYDEYSGLIKACESDAEKKYFLYTDGNRHYKIDVSKIIYITKKNQKLFIKTLSKDIAFRGSLCKCAEQESVSEFLSIQSACIVNPDHIIRYEDKKVYVSSGEELSISRRKERILKDYYFES